MKFFWALPLLLIAGCSSEPIICNVEMDTRDDFDGETVELTVSSPAEPGKEGYGRLQTKRYEHWLAVDLPYVGDGETVAKLIDGRVLYLNCR